MGILGKNKGKGRERMGREGVREGGERPFFLSHGGGGVLA